MSAYIGPHAQVAGSAQVSGSAWVTGSARVYGSAQVSGSAQVTGSAWVTGSARVSGHGDLSTERHFLAVGPVGSEHRHVTVHRARPEQRDGVWVWGHLVVAGCWEGMADELAERIAGTPEEWAHQTGPEARRHRADYEAVIALARPRIAEWEAEPVTDADVQRWADVDAAAVAS